jgi:hypothetical protein
MNLLRLENCFSTKWIYPQKFYGTMNKETKLKIQIAEAAAERYLQTDGSHSSLLQKKCR